MNGETRYIKTQKPGREEPEANTLSRSQRVSDISDRGREIELPAENKAHGEQKVRNVTSSFSRRDTCHNHDRKSSVEEQEHFNVQKHESASEVDSIFGDGIAVITNGIIPGKVDDDTHEN